MSASLQTRTEWRTFSVKNIDSSLARHAKFGYRLVRFGREEAIATLPSEQREAAALQNKDIWADSFYDEGMKEMTVKIPLAIHEVLGTQFKCFIDADFDTLKALRSLLEDDYHFHNIDKPTRGKNRIYLVRADFEMVTTPEGIVNNFQYANQTS